MSKDGLQRAEAFRVIVNKNSSPLLNARVLKFELISMLPEHKLGPRTFQERLKIISSVTLESCFDMCVCMDLLFVWLVCLSGLFVCLASLFVWLVVFVCLFGLFVRLACLACLLCVFVCLFDLFCLFVYVACLFVWLVWLVCFV